MPNSLLHRTLILEGPDGRSWSLPASTVVDYIDDPARRGGMQFGSPTTAGNILARVPYLGLLRILRLAGVSTCPLEDIEAWTHRAASNIPPDGYAFRLEATGAQESLVEALERAWASENPNAILDQVIAELRKPVTTEGVPVPNDGWGHTPKNASTEELLREGAAAEQGSDKHEQVFRQLLGENNERAALELLVQRVSALQKDLTALGKAVEQIDVIQRSYIFPFMRDLTGVRAQTRAQEKAASAQRERDRAAHIQQTSATLRELLESPRMKGFTRPPFCRTQSPIQVVLLEHEEELG